MMNDDKLTLELDAGDMAALDGIVRNYIKNHPDDKGLALGFARRLKRKISDVDGYDPEPADAVYKDKEMKTDE